MASEASASLTVAACGGNTEVFPWLKTLPVAPEYHPTLAEFQDPIAYIFKIEKEASRYGICKIVPPVRPPSKETSIANLDKSLSARSGSGPTFTTRHQQIGFCPRKQRPVQKPVWQSGENYTVPEFERKSKDFEKNYLKKCYKKNLSPLVIETLYWKATVDKPFSVEYANDMPGSAFAPKKSEKDGCKEGNANNNVTVGETEWNMRGVSRAKGSLLRFMKEEIPGVTSPMVYIAMMFSWFAWHVEDHDLHSLNYLHMGAGKTWYGVPRDAAVAFEEVIRVQGYGGEINPLVAFATLGEKTTVMSPEVLVEAGVPCCRLVQNPGEFVVTFPRAYHSGFSHGFNCGEAANIATPEWLRVAKDAAIRRASVNCPPMVSHFQLLYDLALSFSSRLPKNIYLEPRSSRLKDKKKGEGELLVKDLFVQDVMQNNNLLHMLAEGSSVVILPRNSLGTCLNLKAGPEFQSGFSGVCSPDLAMKTTVYDLEKKKVVQPVPKAYLQEMNTPSCIDNRLFSSERVPNALSLSSQIKNVEGEGVRTSWGDRLSEQGLFSCVTCGILCFACVAIVQPTDVAAHNLITTDCSTFKDWEESNDATEASLSGDESLPETESSEGQMNERDTDGLFDVPVQSAELIDVPDSESAELISNGEAQKNTSSLGLLALAYGNSSDSEEDEGEAAIHVDSYKTKCIADSPHSPVSSDQEAVSYPVISNSETHFVNEIPPQFIRPCVEHELTRTKSESRSKHSLDWPVEHRKDSLAPAESDKLIDKSRHQPVLQLDASSCIPATHKAETTMTSGLLPPDNTTPPFSASSDEDSSRKHVFCLQHAIQVEKRLRSVGGAHILLLCHPDYPKVEARARKLAEELGNDNIWSDVSFRQASAEDEEMIRLALESEEAIHGNGDWAVKLGINLYYSANLSRSPLYSKQMPYNFTIYNAFGRSCPTSTMKAEFNGKGPGKLKKIIVAGKWCGKVWMSNQVHQFLAESDHGEKEGRTTYRVKTDAKPERFAEKNSIERASSICKPSRKRKSTEEIKSDAKPKFPKAGEQDEAFEDLPLKCSFKQFKSNLRNKRMKKEKPEPQIKGAKNKRALNYETEDEPKRRSKTMKNKKEFNIEIEEEPMPQNKCEKNKKQLNAEDEDEPKPRNKGVRSKRELNSEEEQDPTSHTKCARDKKHFRIDTKNEPEGGPSTRLRKRPSKPSKDRGAKATLKKQQNSVQQNSTKGKKGPAGSKNSKAKDEKADFPCDVEGCAMSFGSKQELVLHKRNICPVKGCGKKFFSHKYLVQHRRVHVDDRPLKCPWKGCKMTFKWAWARTEHIRVHTGARPYVCSEPDCGQTFRFVSDFSRHKRKTGHSSKKGR